MIHIHPNFENTLPNTPSTLPAHIASFKNYSLFIVWVSLNQINQLLQLFLLFRFHYNNCLGWLSLTITFILIVIFLWLYPKWKKDKLWKINTIFFSKIHAMSACWPKITFNSTDKPQNILFQFIAKNDQQLML